MAIGDHPVPVKFPRSLSQQMEMRKRGRPPVVRSQAVKNRTERKMALLDSAAGSGSRSESDEDNENFVPMGNELAIVTAHEPVVAVDHYADEGHPDKEDVPLQRKRGRRLIGSQTSNKNKTEQQKEKASIEQRMTLLDSCSSERDKDDVNFMPTDEELAFVAADDSDAEQPVPLEVMGPSRTNVARTRSTSTVRPRRGKQRKPLGVHQKSQSKAKRISKGIRTVTRNKVIKSRSSVHGNGGYAMDRAKELQDMLPPAYPSFVKLMKPSHCDSCFWLGIPAYFYPNHLPKQNLKFYLEDENGQNHKTMYLGDRKGPGLSGGWNRFTAYHGIKVDDVVIFQLVDSRKFKVYIVRGNGLDTTGGALGHQRNSRACNKKGKQSKEEGGSHDTVVSEEDIPNSDIDFHEDAKATTFYATTDGIIVSDNSHTEFDGVTSFSDFCIIVDNTTVIDCKFQERQRRAYFELCRSQKSLLHKHLLSQLNITLVVGVITDTVDIAERIRDQGASSSPEDLLQWKKTLESFELLGMNVAFLIKRLNDLLGLMNLMKCEKYRDLKLQQARAGEKVKALELQLASAKDSLRKMDVSVQEMEASAKKSDLTLQELATAPW